MRLATGDDISALQFYIDTNCDEYAYTNKLFLSPPKVLTLVCKDLKDQTSKLHIGEGFADQPPYLIVETTWEVKESVNIEESQLRCISEAGKCVFCVALNKDNAIPLFSVFS